MASTKYLVDKEDPTERTLDTLLRLDGGLPRIARDQRGAVNFDHVPYAQNAQQVSK